MDRIAFCPYGRGSVQLTTECGRGIALSVYAVIVRALLVISHQNVIPLRQNFPQSKNPHNNGGFFLTSVFDKKIIVVFLSLGRRNVRDYSVPNFL